MQTKTIEQLQKENNALRQQLTARDNLLCEANNKLKTFMPASPIPANSEIPKGCVLKFRKGSWSVIDQISKKRVKIGENIKKLKWV